MLLAHLATFGATLLSELLLITDAASQPAGARVLAGMWWLPLKQLAIPSPITSGGKLNRMCQQCTKRAIFVREAKAFCQQ